MRLVRQGIGIHEHTSEFESEMDSILMEFPAGPKRGGNSEKVWRVSWKLFQHAAAQEEMVEMLACLAWRRRTSLQIPNKKQPGPSPLSNA